MVAGPDVALDDAGFESGEERCACQDVVEAPANIPLAHVAPRRPPREETVVIRIDGAAGVDEIVADDPLEQFAFFRKLADRARFALFWMHVPLGAGDVQIATDHE